MSFISKSESVNYKKGIGHKRHLNMDGTYYLPHFSNPTSNDHSLKSINNRSFSDTWEPKDLSFNSTTYKLLPSPKLVRVKESFLETPHKMKIDMQAVDFVLNERKRCLGNRRYSDDEKEKFTETTKLKEDAYVVSTLIEALDELGIEVELNDSRQKSIKLYPDLRLLKLEENIATPVKESLKKDVTPPSNDDAKSTQNTSEDENNPCEALNMNIQEAEMMKTPPRRRKFDDSLTSLDTEHIISSPIIASSSKKIKYRPKRTTEFTKKGNLEAMINFHTPKCWKPNRTSLESTRKIFSNDDLLKKTVNVSKMDNTISTISLANTSNITQDISLSAPAQKTVEENVEMKKISSVETIPSAVENFLENALGSEINSSKTTVDDALSFGYASENMNSDFDVSELLDVTQNKASNDPKQSNQRNSAVSKTRSFCKQLSLRIKKKLRGNSREQPKPIERPAVHINWDQKRGDPNLDSVLEDINTQHILVSQASKALRICLIFEEFQGSREHVECERVLLLALLRKQAAFKELDRIIKEKPEEFCQERGEITIKNISVALREDILHLRKNNSNLVEWYVVVVSHRTTVWASQPLQCPEYSTQINFPNTFKIPNVMPNFKIDFKVYSLKVQREECISHEKKYHIRPKKTGFSCSFSLGQILKRYTDEPNYGYFLAKMYRTSFTECGSIELSLNDLSLTSPWPLNPIPENSNLRGTLDMTFMCKVNLRESHMGFLTHGVGTESYTVWNRRWCVLEGHTLKFWDYPQDTEGKEPLLSIDLIECIRNNVTTVDRAICAKPRTINIETACPKRNIGKMYNNEQSYKIHRNYLACDTLKDLDEWLTKINRALGALCEWNAKRQLTISDLRLR